MKYSMRGKGKGGIAPLPRNKQGCSYGRTGQRNPPAGSGADFNASARGTKAGHAQMDAALKAAQNGPTNCTHPVKGMKPAIK
jgi:hypothetical protein